jgi:hypothetical protein
MRINHRFVPIVNVIVWLALVGVLSPAESLAAIYTWVDAQGVKHFTNTPPPDDVSAVRHDEIQYDAVADRESRAADERFFEQQALKNALRRLAEAERALADSRAREAANRSAEPVTEAVYDDNFYRGSFSYGRGKIYDPYRPRKRNCHRGPGLGRRPGKGDPGCRPKPEHFDGGERTEHVRPGSSGRDGYRHHHRRARGSTGGFYRVRRALPSPYYFGNRPVYPKHPVYGPHRPGHSGRYSHRRAGRPSGSGARIRISF